MMFEHDGLVRPLRQPHSHQPPKSQMLAVSKQTSPMKHSDSTVTHERNRDYPSMKEPTRYCNRVPHFNPTQRPRNASKRLHLLQGTYAKLLKIPTGRSSCKRSRINQQESCGGGSRVKFCFQALIFLASLRKCHPLSFLGWIRC